MRTWLCDDMWKSDAMRTAPVPTPGNVYATKHISLPLFHKTHQFTTVFVGLFYDMYIIPE